ncbi:6667_t:CDS:2 [Acaulospora morrowiae]|uniref:6667_t:CDS:1 n=1 Tax=Acaulospora morrowiae TaxID=94023 RepID=A0A9N9D0X4_9GLOM|nr:6667_t:CDS:2 [Acaulospora morrowiae]
MKVAQLHSVQVGQKYEGYPPRNFNSNANALDEDYIKYFFLGPIMGLPSTTYAIKQMISLYPMLEHIEENKRERTENMPISRLGTVLVKLLDHLSQKSHEH